MRPQVRPSHLELVDFGLYGLGYRIGCRDGFGTGTWHSCYLVPRLFALMRGEDRFGIERFLKVGGPHAVNRFNSNHCGIVILGALKCWRRLQLL
jgi:hypothetical protein